ncbi:PDxFFG protein [Mycoplasma seminis]|uniref:PDxFFG protein n=1 Tax=Mycoplasma seminis TaxID=512749 RepID=A0ABY9HB14_9MOLU|nr:PDxFFG protein [Mycoplasma seminis]WLP85780.1 PDxFFG protein [Mycoplasma seminis]
MLKNWSLKSKILLSLATLAVGSGIAIGSMIAYAENSDEKLGPLSPANKQLFDNSYAKIYDEKGELKPELRILDAQKKSSLAVVSLDGSEFAFKESPEDKMDFDEFFNEYYKRYNEPFVLEVKYGSFSFYDEYVLAVHPKQFIEFSNWFIKNVAWGPDLLTLNSFRIVPGVEQNGNAITLGSHSTLHKEVSEIKFFPDAFFGSLPIYSALGGRGNASDALTYSTFNSEVSKNILDEYLKNIPYASAAKNALDVPENESFKGIIVPSKLNHQKFMVLLDENTNVELGTSSKAVPERAQTLYLPYDVTETEFEQLKTQYPDELQRYSFSDLRPVEILSAFAEDENAGMSNNPSKDLLKITFKYLDVPEKEYVQIEKELDVLKRSEKGKDIEGLKKIELKRQEIKNEYKTTMHFNLMQGRSWISYQNFVKAVKNSIRSFLDFYDIDSYKNETIYVYDPLNGQPLQYFASFLQAINTIPSLKKLSYAEQKEFVKKYKVTEFKITNNIVDKFHTLNVSLVNGKSNKLVVSFTGNTNNNYKPEGFAQFKEAIGYSGAISPVTVFYTPEDIASEEKGLAARKYQAYNETYNGLLDKVLAKYPHLAKKLNGPHITREVNEKGVYEFKLTEGEYVGLTPGDRIGLPLILGALVPGFQGVPTDFLKYVATHEYGHHYTLDQGQAWINDKNPIIVGGLSTRGGANESSYYSYEALVNYLEARTNIEVIRVNANNQPTENGKFIRFKFGILDENGKVTHFETEALEDIWGTEKSHDEIDQVLKNKKRRFLQDFAGMVKAAKERGVALGDLFIANSFDADSGTLNPRISGIGKAFKKIQEASGKTEYKLVPITARNIIEQMTDGAGNPLTKAVTFADDNHFTFKLFETDSKKPNKITKINMFNKDGSPVIQVPLNVELDPESLNYIRTQSDVIGQSISATVRAQMFDSGWNESSSRIGGDFALWLQTLFGGADLNAFVESIKHRSDAAEVNVNENASVKKRKSNDFFALPFGLQSELQTLRDSYINIYERAYDQKKNALDNVKFSAFLKGNKGSVLTFVPNGFEGENSDLNKFFFPYMRENSFLADRINIRDGLSNRMSSIAEDNGFPATNSRWSMYPTQAFITLIGLQPYSADGATNTLLFDSFVAFVDKDTNIVNSQQVWNSSRDALGKFDEAIRGVVLNPYSRFMKANDKELLKAVNKLHQQMVIVTDRENARDNLSAPKFKSFYELINFASIDYSKAKYDTNIKNYNWDVEYVKTKFNLFEIKSLAEKDTELTTANLREQINSASDENAQEQAVANYAMYRFRHSNLVLSVKEFSPALDLVANSAIFSKDYGIDMISETFKKYYVQDLTSAPEENKNLYFDAEKLQKYLEQFIQDNNLSQYIKYFSMQDFVTLAGNVMFFKNGGETEMTIDNILFGGFSSGESSDDVKNYNDTRVEPLLNDKFTDYIYSIAETLTRDYVQTVYSPNKNDFGNTPSYLKGLSEAITGLDYIVDGTAINYLNELKNNNTNMSTGIKESLEADRYNEFYQQHVAGIIEFNKRIQKTKTDKKELSKLLDSLSVNDPEYDAIHNAIETLNQTINSISDERHNYISNAKAKFFDDISAKRFFQDYEYRDSSYFGKFISNSNGFFKDRFEKETIGMELYDVDGNPIVDQNIRLKDFEGNRITNRPEAFFISQLYNYGVSKRNISGIFRNKDLDALAMYGYIKNDLATQAKYLKFTDVDTKEEIFLSIHTEKTNNIFWLQKQGDVSAKKTIEDYGYTSWLSDYALMAKYRDALLKPKHRYYMEFADENKKAIQDIDLGNVQALAENAKAVQQSPIKIVPEVETNAQGEKVKTGKTIINVDFQFNISH